MKKLKELWTNKIYRRNIFQFLLLPILIELAIEMLNRVSIIEGIEFMFLHPVPFFITVPRTIRSGSSSRIFIRWDFITAPLPVITAAKPKPLSLLSSAPTDFHRMALQAPKRSHPFLLRFPGTAALPARAAVPLLPHPHPHPHPAVHPAC